jgi:two-component system NtrC family sensor kinase
VREYDPGNPTLVVDAQKLQQVVLNLINNSYDAIQEKQGGGGTIWVRTLGREPSVVITIEDDGTGFSELERVFDPFYTTKEIGKGTGLGLSVCYGLIHEHGGKIQAENWELGARIRIELPCGEPVATPLPAAAPAGQARSAKPIRALIVDDEPMITRLQTSILDSLGIECTAVSSGDDALAFLEKNQPDIVISDVRMPGVVDGIGLYHWLLEHHPNLQERFLFITGDSVALSSDAVGIPPDVPCLEKPFLPADYAATVLSLLDLAEDDR